ncbi:Fur family transcriptional regulator [Salana multivorans]
MTDTSTPSERLRDASRATPGEAHQGVRGARAATHDDAAARRRRGPRLRQRLPVGAAAPRALRARGQRIGLATVYRTLASMAELGEVDAIRAPDGETRYRRCELRVHHHHLVCRSCGAAVELDARAVEKWATALAAQHAYTDVEHTVELFGLCPACSAR